MDYKQFVGYIAEVAEAHQEKALPDAHTHRTFPSGESNPYFTHCVWCAMMILLDTKLPANIRETGAEVLLFHDVLEDTSADLPKELSPETRRLIDEMTYKNWDEEKTIILTKPPLVQLLKLYDKSATLYDAALSRPRHKEWADVTEKLTDNVEKEYGTLNIVVLARELVKQYK